ncbi:hypothetical protein ACFL1H_01240, partial [Nanoarchaeota archaeon]
DTFDLCLMDVKDRNNDIIRGVFLYRLNTYNKTNEILKNQLSGLINSDNSQSFDLGFQVFSEHYLKKTGVDEENMIYNTEKVYRGPRILIKYIRRRDNDDGEPDEPVKEFTSVPVGALF